MTNLNQTTTMRFKQLEWHYIGYPEQRAHTAFGNFIITGVTRLWERFRGRRINLYFGDNFIASFDDPGAAMIAAQANFGNYILDSRKRLG